ncbi:MAG: SUMF1/EgtB/PvdO family nonheme iron enzyme [Verrucomicrobiales bacterium]
MSDGKHAGERLGDYELLELLCEGTHTRSWKARQISVDRQVIVEIVKTRALGDREVIANFLDDVRVKAKVHHPAIGQVFEAGHREGTCFYAREILEGGTLEDQHASARKLSPLEVATLLEKIAEAQVYCEKHEIATLPWEPGHIHFTSDLQVNLVNLAVAAPPAGPTESHNKAVLAEAFLDLLDDKKPGATRLGSLLGYMHNDLEAPISWPQIHDYARKIRETLSRQQHTSPIARSLRQTQQQLRQLPAWLWALLGGLLVLILLVSVLKKPAEPTPAASTEPSPPPAAIPDRITIPAQPEAGIPVALSLDLAEVSIADYAAFLDHLDGLPAAEKNRYDHPRQPKRKSGHLPADWEALRLAAQNEGLWNAQVMRPECPIVNVDWWDASAYARWKNARLPTLAEWQAISALEKSPAISAWGPARASSEDRSPTGLIGLAGNVAEWLEDRHLDPANPLNPKQVVAAGGSYLNPAQGQDTLIRLDSPEERRPDLGFRTIRPAEPAQQP